MITQSQITDLLEYAPETGVFCWRRSSRGRAAGERAGGVYKGHRHIRIDGVLYKEANLAWLYVHGEFPEHIRFENGNPLDLRIANLQPSVAKPAGSVVTQDELKDLLNYNPETGEFTWRSTGSGRKLGQPAGSPWSNGHLSICIAGRSYQASRLAWLYVYGEDPGGRVKFVDENPLNLRIANLRMARTREEHGRLFRQRNPHAFRKYNLRKNYGIEIDEYARMLVEQKGVCGACGEPETATRHGKLRTLCVDHCHTTGDVRGLLCLKCNTSIGYADDDAQRLRQLADYLDRHAAKAAEAPPSNVVRLKG